MLQTSHSIVIARTCWPIVRLLVCGSLTFRTSRTLSIRRRTVRRQLFVIYSISIACVVVGGRFASTANERVFQEHLKGARIQKLRSQVGWWRDGD